MGTHERKRRTREHIVADLSVNHVERHALVAGYIADRTAHDYGIDLEITTFNHRGEIEDGKILMQLKATDKLKPRRDGIIPHRLQRSDLVFWVSQAMPVILVLYDAASEVAYWLYVQSYFRKLKEFNLFAAGKTITVSISPRNVVDPRAMERFAGFRDRVFEQMIGVIHDEDESDPIQ